MQTFLSVVQCCAQQCRCNSGPRKKYKGLYIDKNHSIKDTLCSFSNQYIHLLLLFLWAKQLKN